MVNGFFKRFNLFVPLVNNFPVTSIEVNGDFIGQNLEIITQFIPAFFFRNLHRKIKAIKFLCDYGLLLGPVIIFSDSFGNFWKIPDTFWWDDVDFFGHLLGVFHRSGKIAACFFDNFLNQSFVKLVCSGIVKLWSDWAINRHFWGFDVEQAMVALILFFYIAQSIECTPFIKFIEGNNISKIQHINLL